MRERDAALDLPLARAPRQLPHALHDLRESRGRQRVAAALEPA